MNEIPAKFKKAPFPYFGGKSTIASEVWQRLGQPGITSASRNRHRNLNCTRPGLKPVGGERMGFQPLYGCVVSRDKPVKIGFWRRLWFAIFGGFIRRWETMGGAR